MPGQHRILHVAHGGVAVVTASAACPRCPSRSSSTCTETCPGSTTPRCRAARCRSSTARSTPAGSASWPPSGRRCRCRWSAGTAAFVDQPSARNTSAITNITRSGVRNRARPISACLPTGPPITCDSAPAERVGPAGQVAVVGAAQVERPAAAATPWNGAACAPLRVRSRFPALGHGGGGGPGRRDTRRNRRPRRLQAHRRRSDRAPATRRRRSGTVVGGPNGIVMPGATSMRRLDHRLRRRRGAWRRRRRRRRRAHRRSRRSRSASGTTRCRCPPARRPSWPSRCRTAGPTRTPAPPHLFSSGLVPSVVPTQTAVDSDGVKPTIQASRLAPVSPSWLVPVLAADGRPPARSWPLEYAGDRLHGGGDVVGDGLVDALLAGVVLAGGVEEHLALGVDHLLHEVRPVVDARGGDRGVRRRHVDHPTLVLAQHDAVVRRAALAVLGQGVLDAGEALGDAGLVRGVGDVGRPVLQLQHQPVVAGVQRPLERLGDVAGAAAARPRRW